MSANFGNHVKFNGYEARNMALHNVSVLPTTAIKGQIYYLTTVNKAFYYDGTDWQLVGSQVKKHFQDLGDGTDSVFTVAHNLGNKQVVVSITEKATGEAITTTWKAVSITEVEITFGNPPAANQYEITVIG